MMVFLFVKRGENEEIHGVDIPADQLPADLVAKQTELTNAGYVLSEPAEYVAQVIDGSKAPEPVPAEVPAAEAPSEKDENADPTSTSEKAE